MNNKIRFSIYRAKNDALINEGEFDLLNNYTLLFCDDFETDTLEVNTICKNICEYYKPIIHASDVIFIKGENVVHYVLENGFKTIRINYEEI